MEAELEFDYAFRFSRSFRKISVLRNLTRFSSYQHIVSSMFFLICIVIVSSYSLQWKLCCSFACSVTLWYHCISIGFVSQHDMMLIDRICDNNLDNIITNANTPTFLLTVFIAEKCKHFWVQHTVLQLLLILISWWLKIDFIFESYFTVE